MIDSFTILSVTMRYILISKLILMITTYAQVNLVKDVIASSAEQTY